MVSYTSHTCARIFIVLPPTSQFNVRCPRPSTSRLGEAGSNSKHSSSRSSLPQDHRGPNASAVLTLHNNCRPLVSYLVISQVTQYPRSAPVSVSGCSAFKRFAISPALMSVFCGNVCRFPLIWTCRHHHLCPTWCLFPSPCQSLCLS